MTQSRPRVHVQLAWPTTMYVLAAAGLWIVSLAAGLILDATQAAIKPPTTSGGVLGLTGIPATSTLGYLLHNGGLALAEWLASITVLVPLWVLWQNGLSLAHYLLVTASAPPSTMAARIAFLIPHGLFEIPAILLTTASALYIAHTTVERVLANGQNVSIIHAYLRTIPVLVVALGLFVVAAVFEAHLSPIIAHTIGGLV